MNKHNAVTANWNPQVSDDDDCAPELSPNPQQGVPTKTFPHRKQVGAYLIGKTIGEGSFAKVKEGLHVLTGEKVAVKVIDKRKARADRYVCRNMRREARLLQRIRHCNIVQLFDVMETEHGFYLVMEYCGGGDMMTKICDSHVIEEADARLYVRQIVSAVDYLHRAGILHRDLKVENLLLNEKGKVKIIDFGLSNIVRRGVLATDGARSCRSVPDTDRPIIGDDYHSTLTSRQATVLGLPAMSDQVLGEVAMTEDLCTTQCGSPAYAAPELLSGEKYGPKVDVWSIGVNMFAMLTGNLPFTVEPFSVRGLLNKMMNGHINELPSYLTKNCQDLLKRFLTANPDRRISLYQAMHHPWLAEGRYKPMEPAPFPNRLPESALCQTVLEYMTGRLGYRCSDIVRLVTDNVPSGATATYHLLLRRLGTNRPTVPHSSSGSETSRAPLRRRRSDITGEKSSTVDRKATADTSIVAKHPEKNFSRCDAEDYVDYDSIMELVDDLTTTASKRSTALPPLSQPRRVIGQHADTNLDTSQITQLLAGNGIKAIAEDRAHATSNRRDHVMITDIRNAAGAQPETARQADTLDHSVIDRTLTVESFAFDLPKRRPLDAASITFGHDVEEQESRDSRKYASSGMQATKLPTANWSIGIPTAMVENEVHSAMLPRTNRVCLPHDWNRDATSLDRHEPLLANSSKQSTDEDREEALNVPEAIGTSTPRRLLGRRRLLQPVSRITLRPSVGVFGNRSNDVRHVITTAGALQKQQGSRNYSEQLQRASQPSEYHVVELRLEVTDSKYSRRDPL